MKSETTKMLAQTMKDVIGDAMLEVDVKGIMIEHIEKTTKSIVGDMFGTYSDFSKSLEKKLAEDIDFNIKKISVPNFGQIAIDSVVAELSKAEVAEKEKIEKEVIKSITNFIGSKGEAVTLKMLADAFGADMWHYYIEDDLDSCHCEGDGIDNEDIDNVLEFLEYHDDYTFEFVIEEKTHDYSTWSSTHTHINMIFTKKGEVSHVISMYVSREKDENKKETWDNHDAYNASHNNLYKILSVDINGKPINNEGTVVLPELRKDADQKVAGCFLNGTLIDANELGVFEVEEV